jgi:transposase
MGAPKGGICMLFIGIDWSRDKYDICICNEYGARICQLTITVTLAGFMRLEQERLKLQIPAQQCVVAIETESTLLVDFLLERGYVIYIIPPHATNAYRQIEKLSIAHNDQSDAALLAWVARVDRRRHRRLRPNAPLTQQILQTVRLVHQLSKAIYRQRNQLNNALARTFPAALTAFDDLTSQTALQFLAAYPTAAEARALCWDDFVSFFKSCGYYRTRYIARRYNILQEETPLASETTVRATRDQVRILAQAILPQTALRKEVLTTLSEQFAQHPDREIFASLPGAGELLAPSLLAKFGDDRSRFPQPGNVQALAGTCPLTVRSGKTSSTRFRTHCDREFRRIAQQFAYCSLRQSAWAKAYWAEIRPRYATTSHATRVVANRWLAIIWKLWQTSQPYDEAYHLRQRYLRRKAKVVS